MVIFVNGAFGVGKTTVARLLCARLPQSAVFDPEPIGVVLSRAGMQWLLGKRTGDFRDLALWRHVRVRGIRLMRRFRQTVIVPMAFSNASYLREFLSYARRCDAARFTFASRRRMPSFLSGCRRGPVRAVQPPGSFEDPPNAAPLIEHRSSPSRLQRNDDRRRMWRTK